MNKNKGENVGYQHFFPFPKLFKWLLSHGCLTPNLVRDKKKIEFKFQIGVWSRSFTNSLLHNPNF